MTDDSDPLFRRGLAADLDRAVDWAKAFLSTRKASDWAFFACGIAIGHFLF
ncbi:hypothetical protein [Dongia mobilis]|uniref:hypothetical protein n=1 Tax=Dongia sp. TaxID=1977262 RepID=UPI0026EE4AD3